MYRLLAMDSVNLVLIEWPIWREIYDGEQFYGQARILFPFIWFNHIPEYNSFSSRLTSVLLLQTWFDLVSILADNRNLSTDATQNKNCFHNADSLVAVIRVIKKKILWWHPRFQKSLPHTESEQKFLKKKSCLKIENLKQIFCFLLSGWSLCSNNF